MNIIITDVSKILSCKTKLAIVYALADSSSSLSSMELSVISDVLPQTFTHHIKMLTKIGLVGVEKYGREKRYFLTNHKFLDIVESLEELVPNLPESNKTTFIRLSFARSCYDHLAGWLATEVTNDLVRTEMIAIIDGDFHITTNGERYFDNLGVDVDAVRKKKRVFARCCIDWTQRKPHIGGALGSALMKMYRKNRYFNSDLDDRKLTLTKNGHEFFLRTHSIDSSRYGFINMSNKKSFAL